MRCNMNAYTRICIVGAGAIGGYVGAKLAAAGEDVTFIARWKNLDAIRARGMTVKFKDGSVLEAKHAKATDSFAAVGHVDCIILAVKANQVEGIVNQLEPLYGPKTTVITMQNGIPFWYFLKHGGALQGTRVNAVDPTGVCVEGIDPARIIGCVVYPAAELVAPGVVSKAAARSCSASSSRSESPCTTPPGGCRMTAWQQSEPSG